MTASARPAGDPGKWLAALEQAHAAATPGPWKADDEGFHDLEAVDEHGFGERIGQLDAAEDVVLIVAMHTALPRLIAAVRAVHDYGDVLRAIADDMLAAFPPEDGEVEPEAIYAWLLNQAAALSVPPAPEEKP